MGVVWKAHDTTLGRDIAIKVLPDLFASDPERLARFEREARLLASLNHPRIAAIYGFHAEGGVRFLAMELAEGESLAARLTHGPLPVADSLRDCAPARRSARGGARARHHPPRSEARQHHGGARWHREGARLRARQGARRRSRPGLEPQPVAVADHHAGDDQRQRDPRHRRLHEPRAGARPGGRQARRRLGVRRDPVRDADRTAALPGRHHLGHAGRSAARRSRLERHCRATRRPACAG